jgi:glycosyltransferase involved in cell wall biosynthesis
MLANSPLMIQVSFVIIALNEAQGIVQCIEAILHQRTELTYEIILIDDGSTDFTADIVRREFGNRVQVHSQPNLGRGESRFNGIQIANAPLIAFVDGDIILPENWLETCHENLGDYSGVGGIAVPDGDCSTIHRLLSLEAKVKAGSVSLTGNNALIKKSALREISSGWRTPLGEDFRLNQLLLEKGYLVSNIPNLVVEHNEHKSYVASLRWLMVSGIDATRLALQFKRLRTPDLAFILWLITFLWLVSLLVTQNAIFGIFTLILVTAIIATFHFISKFRILKTPLRSLLGILLNFPLIASYLLGRLFGLFIVIFEK